MNIFSRLIKIIGSNLSYSDTDNDLLADFDHFENTNAQHNFDETESQQNRQDRDPELAGYYANLEVPYGSNLNTVRKSWKRLVGKYHPDLHSSDPKKRQVANELTQGLNRAYQELAKKLKKNESKT